MSLIWHLKQRFAVFLKERSSARFGSGASALQSSLHGDEDPEDAANPSFMDTDIAVTWLYEACNQAHSNSSARRP